MIIQKKKKVFLQQCVYRVIISFYLKDNWSFKQRKGGKVVPKLFKLLCSKETEMDMILTLFILKLVGLLYLLALSVLHDFRL